VIVNKGLFSEGSRPHLHLSIWPERLRLLGKDLTGSSGPGFFPARSNPNKANRANSRAIRVITKNSSSIAEYSHARMLVVASYRKARRGSLRFCGVSTFGLVLLGPFQYDGSALKAFLGPPFGCSVVLSYGRYVRRKNDPGLF
jgi:hypothetical protein